MKCVELQCRCVVCPWILLVKLRYMVRQPIFDRDEKVFGYELLFRDDMENAFYDVDPDIASRSTLDSSCW